jgi:hypothetical protein
MITHPCKSCSGVWFFSQVPSRGEEGIIISNYTSILSFSTTSLNSVVYKDENLNRELRWSPNVENLSLACAPCLSTSLFNRFGWQRNYPTRSKAFQSVYGSIAEPPGFCQETNHGINTRSLL